MTYDLLMSLSGESGKVLELPDDRNRKVCKNETTIYEDRLASSDTPKFQPHCHP